jgi:hypothetical protein
MVKELSAKYAKEKNIKPQLLMPRGGERSTGIRIGSARWRDPQRKWHTVARHQTMLHSS